MIDPECLWKIFLFCRTLHSLLLLYGTFFFLCWPCLSLKIIVSFSSFAEDSRQAFCFPVLSFSVLFPSALPTRAALALHCTSLTIYVHHRFWLLNSPNHGVCRNTGIKYIENVACRKFTEGKLLVLDMCTWAAFQLWGKLTWNTESNLKI